MQHLDSDRTREHTRDAIYGADNGAAELSRSRYTHSPLINRASQFHPSVGTYWPTEDFRFHFFTPTGVRRDDPPSSYPSLFPPAAEIGETVGQAGNSGSAFYLYTEDLCVQAFHSVREIEFYRDNARREFLKRLCERK